jgi:predicted dehydrogenase
MRIAVFDVSHWHFSLYVPALTDPGIEIVGISDQEGFTGFETSQRLNCPLLSRDELLDRDFDFALIFSRHSEMAATAGLVVAKGKPFLIEKPCGLNSEQVAMLRSAVKKAGLFATVPFILRVSDLAKELSQSGQLSAAGYRHLSFRFIVGASSRYERNGCTWMLAKSTAGGGSVLNVGVHFFDLLESLTSSPITSVTAQTRTFRKDIDIDELALFTVTMASGQIGHVHTGYLYPGTPDDQREFGFSVSHVDSYLQGFSDQIVVKAASGETRHATVEYNTDHFYPIFLRDALKRCREGRAPLVGLDEALRAVSVVEAGYQSADRGGVPVAVSNLDV